MKIRLAGGQEAHVDDEDGPLVAGIPWRAHKTGGRWYAAARIADGGKRKQIYLHRLVTGAGRERISFRNGNSLDCRKKNLEINGQLPQRKTFEMGALGEARVIADLTSHQHEVFIPVSGHTAADLVSITPGGKTLRWQVKTRQTAKGTNSIRISLLAVHPQKGGYKRKAYDLGLIDGFAICCLDPDVILYVPCSDIDDKKGSFSVCFGPNAEAPNVKNFLDYLAPDF